jgi:MFS family permease
MTDTTAVSVGKGKIAPLVAVCLAALILPLSFSGGAVATPTIGRHLGGSAVALNWITNAFMLTFGSLLMAAGALADQYGRKRIFTLGVSAFAVISLALSLAPSVLILDLLRAAQGIAAAAALSGGSAALAQEFEGHARTRAFSMLGTTFGVGLAFGPLLAGLLIESFGWRSVFLSSALVGVLALLFGGPRMRESRDPDATGLDWPGTISFTGALSLFTFGVIQAPASGWSSPLIIALLVGAALSLAAFVLVETRVARPMLDLSLFRYPRFIGVQVLPIATCSCYVVLLVLLPLRFIGVEGQSEIGAGLLMLALSAPMLIVPFLAASLARWISAGVISGTGLLLAAAGLLWLSRIAPAAPRYEAVPPMLLIGLGASMPWGLMDGLSVSVVPKERAGMATGIFGTTRVAGEGVALAIVSAILAGLMQVSLARLFPDATTGGSERMIEAAGRLATGDLRHASALLPEIGRTLLTQSYGTAFQSLLYILAAITFLSAVAVFGFLGNARPRASDQETDGTIGEAFASDQGAS